MDKGVELIIWIGLAGLALTSAQLLLWHTRRLLSQSMQDTHMHEGGLVPPTHLVAPAVAQTASSVLAS